MELLLVAALFRRLGQVAGSRRLLGRCRLWILRPRGRDDVEVLGWPRVAVGGHRHTTDQNVLDASLVQEAKQRFQDRALPSRREEAAASATRLAKRPSAAAARTFFAAPASRSRARRARVARSSRSISSSVQAPVGCDRASAMNAYRTGRQAELLEDWRRSRSGERLRRSIRRR